MDFLLMAFATKNKLQTVLSLGIGFIVGAWPAQSLGQGQLPFPDGRYVTDPAYCAMSEAQIVDQLGEVAGANVRTIAGNRIINPYFGSCTVQSSSIAEGALVLSQQCSAEGETFSVLDLWEIETDTSFRNNGSFFALCSVDSAAGSTSLPSLDADVVFALQLDLLGLGFDPGRPDGVMGPQTRSALTEFQRRNGLQQTGSMNAETRVALDRATTELFAGIAAEFEQRAEQTQPVEEFNSDEIFSAQVALQRLGFRPGVADGEFGSQTRQAMNAFQRQYGLQQTEALNRETLELLVREDTALFADAETLTDEQATPIRIPPTEQAMLELEDTTGSDVRRDHITLEHVITRGAGLVTESLSARFFLAMSLAPNQRAVLEQRGTLEQFLSSSVMVIGCGGPDQHAVGFFNAALHSWIVAWLDSDGSILNAELSFGFEIDSNSEKTAWILADDATPIEESLNIAFQDQISAFNALFSYTDCIDSTTLGQFRNTEAAALMLEHLRDDTEDLGSSTIDQIIRKTAEFHAFDQNSDLNLTFVSDNIGPHDLFTIHTSTSIPSILILQHWSRAGKLLNIEISSAFNLLERQMGQ